MKPQLSSQSLLQPADRRDSHRELGWTPAQSQDSWCFHFVLTVRFHVCIIMRYVSKLVLTNRFPRYLATNCNLNMLPHLRCSYTDVMCNVFLYSFVPISKFKMNFLCITVHTKRPVSVTSVSSPKTMLLAYFREF